MIQIFDEKASTSMIQMRPHEMLALMEKEAPYERWRSRCTVDGGIEAGSDASWYGGEETQASLDAKVREGWTSGLKQIAQTASKITGDLGAVKQRKRRRVMSEDEGELDAERLYAGEELFLVDSRKEWTKGNKYIQISAEWGGNCRVTAEQMFYTGAVALILCNKLEDAGYRVRLTLTSVGAKQNEGVALSVTQLVVKEYEEPLDLDGLATLACHAGAFRTYGFRSFYENKGEPLPGLGQRRPLFYVEDILRKHGLLEEGTQVIDAVHSPEAAIGEARRILAELAV